MTRSITSRRYTNGSMPRCLHVSAPASSSTAGSVRRGLAAGEQPVLASEHDRPQRLLGAVVVDLERAILGVARQRRPVVARVRDGLPERALRQRLSASVEIAAEPCQDRRERALALAVALRASSVLSRRSSP